MSDGADGSNRLRVFGGELFVSPAPLELSFSTCTRCEYCFAANNGRDVDAKASGTLKHIANVFSTGGSPKSFADQLLLARHPIVFSNAVDPLFHPNIASTRAVLPLLKKLGVPVVFQTRGTMKPADFAEYLAMLPRGSIVYMSITTFDEAVHKQWERGCPRNEERLEMLAMAHAAGFRTVAGINPAVQEWIGDPYAYVERMESLAGVGAIDGTWIEIMHLSRKQLANMTARPRGLELAELAPTLAASARGGPEYDETWMEELRGAVDEKQWKRYSFNVGDGVASVFELYPRPFVTHHKAIAACQEKAGALDGVPVLVTFDTWAAHVGIPEMVLSRGDAWSWLNTKQTFGVENRKALPEALTLREVLRLLWNRPDVEVMAVWGGANFKPVLTKTTDGGYCYASAEDGGDLIACYVDDGEEFAYEDELPDDVEYLAPPTLE